MSFNPIHSAGALETHCVKKSLSFKKYNHYKHEILRFFFDFLFQKDDEKNFGSASFKGPKIQK